MKQFFLAVGVTMVANLTANAQVTKKTAPKPTAATSSKTVGAVKPLATTAILKSTIDSFSYALGINIANNLKSQGIDKISSIAMQRAMSDVFTKKKLLLDEQQANMCIQQTIQVNMSKKNEVVKAKGTAFLTANKKRPGVIVLPDGLQYEVLTKGNGGSATPTLQDTVVAHYKGTLIDGKQFDNSYERGEPLTIPVGGVIRGWTEVLQLMHIGDKWKVYIPSELGYGERGAGADIPGGAALIFEMELLGIKSAAVAQAPKQP